MDEIKICLGTYYCGSIIQAIEKLKFQANKDLSLSFREELDIKDKKVRMSFGTVSFRNELFEDGLEISQIGPSCVESENVETLKQEILKKDIKIEKKKRTLQLHQQQITVLKDQIRKNSEEIKGYQDLVKEWENKMQSALSIDVQYIKQVYGNLVVNIKVDKGTEDLIILLFRILEFSNDEVQKLQQQRKGNKKIIKKGF